MAKARAPSSWRLPGGSPTSTSICAEGLPAAAKAVLQFQPLYPVFASYQAIFGGDTPSPALLVMSAVWAGVLLVIGGRVFLKHEREFALYL